MLVCEERWAGGWSYKGMLDRSVREAAALGFEVRMSILFSRESLRVCMKGTVRGGDIRGSSTWKSRLLVLIALSCLSTRLSMMDDLLRL